MIDQGSALFSDFSEVVLVNMPYASVERPSIGLSILQSALKNHGVDSRIIYGNLLFAEKIGPHLYDVIDKRTSPTLAGEWTFSPACFPDFQSNESDYFNHTRKDLDKLHLLIENMGFSEGIWHLLKKIKSVTTPFIEELAYQVIEMSPKVVGCSSTFQQHCASLALLRKVKALNPQIVTVIGGANCEASMGLATHKECSWVDYLVSGEAEVVFPELVKGLLKEQHSFPNLYGVIGPDHREQDSYINLYKEPPRASVKNMNDSPAPNYDNYFDFLRHSKVAKFIQPSLVMETSRGCWWGAISHCTFCGLNSENMRHRSKDPERVFDELNEMTAKYGIKTVVVVDNILEMNYFNTLIPKLTDQRKKYSISYEIKANLKKTQIKQLSDAGIRWLIPGIESLDDSILKMIGKGSSSKINLQLIKWAREYGIYLFWFFLYDFPKEEDVWYVEMSKWLPQIAHLHPPLEIAHVQYHRFSPYQTDPKKYDIFLSPDSAYDFIYPWSQSSIEQFAYYFDDYSKERVRIDYLNSSPTSRPGLDSIKDVVGYWQNDWRHRDVNDNIEDQMFNFVYEYRGESIHVFDTRRCAVREEHRLLGIRKVIFEFCDGFQSKKSISKHLEKINPDWGDAQTLTDILNELTEDLILLKIGEQYFTPAIQFPYRPLPRLTDFTGGRILSQEEVLKNTMKGLVDLNS